MTEKEKNTQYEENKTLKLKYLWKIIKLVEDVEKDFKPFAHKNGEISIGICLRNIGKEKNYCSILCDYKEKKHFYLSSGIFKSKEDFFINMDFDDIKKRVNSFLKQITEQETPRKNKIIVISGKAQSGKTTTLKYLQSKLDNTAEFMISKTLKDYAKTYFGWNGEEDTKPRQFLQDIGNYIRFDLNEPNFLIKRTCEDVKILSKYFDTIIISDCRFKKEIEYLKEEFGDDLFTIRIERPNYDSGLTKEQLLHASEIDLDDYNGFDCTVINDGTVEELEKEISLIIS